MIGKDLHFKDLVSTEDWQGIQDSLAEVLEITIRTFSAEGELLSKTSRSTRLLDEILPKVHKTSNLCGNCLLKSKVSDLKYLKKEAKLKCPFDLDVVAVPIKAVGEKSIVYIVLGPVILKSRKNIFEYAKEAKEFGVDLEKLADALIEISVFSYNRIDAVIKLVEGVFSHILQSGYHKRRLGEIRPEVVELDPLFSRYYEEKILSALLNSCTLALDADSGSVMTLDKNTDMLHIKVASKLDKDVVSNTTIKMGEGIAGLAAATAEPIILPQDKAKNHISEKMKREYIKSSMIVPFNRGKADEVYGVINLNIIRKDIEFSQKDISLVKELVSMASVALIPLGPSEFMPNSPGN